MVCPCVFNPYFTIAPIAFIYAYFSQNRFAFALFVAAVASLFLYLYLNPTVFYSSYNSISDKVSSFYANNTLMVKVILIAFTVYYVVYKM